MTLNITKIQKRKRNYSYDFIVIRKDYEIIDTIGVLYHKIRIAGFDRKFLILDLLKIEKWLNTTSLRIPFWLNKYILVLRNISFSSKLICEDKEIQSYVGYSSHLNDLIKLKKYHLPFYRFKIFTRTFLRIRNIKLLKIKTNVRLYHKKI